MIDGQNELNLNTKVYSRPGYKKKKDRQFRFNMTLIPVFSGIFNLKM